MSANNLGSGGSASRTSLDAAARAQRYVGEMDLGTFVADDRTLDAVSRCAESSARPCGTSPQDVIDAHPELPWSEMRAMRDVNTLREYFGVTSETLWKTAREDLPAIIEPLRALLASSNS
ncbi:MAG: HepT-like ribonuclease domain-containing protein [Anaeromyxobacter sp.]